MLHVIAELQILKSAKELAEPPEWFQVFPYGEVLIEGDEPAIMEEEGAALVLAHFKSLEHDMVIDYEHQTLKGVKAPAAGWIKELEWRGEEGLWARAEWTEEAAVYIQKKEYRYFSPVFFVRKSDRKIVELYNVALTNQPQMMNVRALAAKYEATHFQGRRNNMLEKIKKMLGLKSEASEAETVQAIEGLVAKNKELETAGKIVACKSVLEALGLKSEATEQEAIQIITGLKAPGDAAKELSQEVVKLRNELAEMKRDDLVQVALKEGKTSPEELDKWGRDLALKNPEQFRQIVLSRPKGSVVPLEKLRDTDPPGGGRTEEAVLQVAKMMGNTEEDLKKYGGLQ